MNNNFPVFEFHVTGLANSNEIVWLIRFLKRLEFSVRRNMMNREFFTQFVLCYFAYITGVFFAGSYLLTNDFPVATTLAFNWAAFVIPVFSSVAIEEPTQSIRYIFTITQVVCQW